MRSKAQNNAVKNHIVREAERIATRKENFDALSWNRVEEIGRALQDCEDQEIVSALGQELMSISQTNQSLARKLGMGADSQSRGQMSSGMEMYGDDLYTQHVLVNGKEVELMEAVASSDELAETAYLDDDGTVLGADALVVEAQVEVSAAESVADADAVDADASVDADVAEVADEGAEEAVAAARADETAEAGEAAEAAETADAEDVADAEDAAEVEAEAEPDSPAEGAADDFAADQPGEEKKQSWFARWRAKREDKIAATIEREMNREEKISVPRGEAEIDKVEVDDDLLNLLTGQGNIEDEYEIFKVADKVAQDQAKQAEESAEAFVMPKAAPAVVDADGEVAEDAAEAKAESTVAADSDDDADDDDFAFKGKHAQTKGSASKHGRHAHATGAEQYTAEDIATFKLVYESKDGRMCIYEDKEGHLVSVDASKLV